MIYKWAGDYLIPDLTIKVNDKPVGKYGRMRLRYLQEHRKGLYSVMLLNGTLQNHLAEIDEVARNRIERMVKRCAKQEGINEELKARDPMEWVRWLEKGIDFKYHHLRHTYGTHLADMNIPPHLLCNQMGHGKIETTRKYYIAVSEDGFAELKRGIELL